MEELETTFAVQQALLFRTLAAKEADLERAAAAEAASKRSVWSYVKPSYWSGEAVAEVSPLAMAACKSPLRCI